MNKFNIENYLFNIENKTITSFNVNVSNITMINIEWRHGTNKFMLYITLDKDDTIIYKRLRIDYKYHGYMIDKDVPKFSFELKTEDFPIGRFFLWFNIRLL